MANKFTQKAQNALNEAHAFAEELGHSYIGTEHLLYALALQKESISSRILSSKGVWAKRIKQSVIDYMGIGTSSAISSEDMTPRLRKIIENSALESARAGTRYVGTEHLLCALLNCRDCVGARLLEADGIPISELKSELAAYLGSAPYRSGAQKRGEESDGKKDRQGRLRSFGKDLTALAAEGNTDPVIGRDAETDRLVRILCRRQKNNPCIIGDPGVGKTAIVEGLALRIAEGRVPSALQQKKIITLDLASMIAGAKYRGEFEERMKSVIDEVKGDPNIILFIDEVHMIVGAGGAEGAIDAANILKPPLARGEIRMIGATTLEEYRSHIEKDSAFERRLQTLMLEEPSEEEAEGILLGLREKYEKHHNIRISDSAIRAAVSLSARYLPDRHLPDKAIDLLDEAAAKLGIFAEESGGECRSLELRALAMQKERAIIEKNFDVAEDIARRERELSTGGSVALMEVPSDRIPELTGDDIAALVTEQTGIPCQSLLSSQVLRLSGLEQKLRERIIGQDAAIKKISDAIKRTRTGLSDPRRPVGSFLFLGSSGVGKTELCRALAQIMFDSPDALIRLDMSEYMEKHSISKLIGAPPGYVGYGEGGILTEKVRRHPYSVILLDEIEKAHPDVLNLLLQIMEDGVLSDATGRRTHFSSSVLIMTSNLADATAQSKCKLGFGEGEEVEDIRAERRLCEFFKPEFLNRVDEIVRFLPLGEPELCKICELMLADLKRRARSVGVSLDISEEVAPLIARRTAQSKGRMGARPIRREITDAIETPLASLILSKNPQKVRVRAVGSSVLLE